MAKITHPLVVPSCRLKLLLIVLLIASWLLIDVDETHACTCMPISPSEAFDAADLVFAGQVIDAQTFYYPVPKISRDVVGRDYFEDTVYIFLVSAVWKGEPKQVSYIISPQNSTSCTGRGFSIGEKYLVYVESGVAVGPCSRIVRLDSAQEDLRALGAGQPPESGTVATRPFSMDNGCSWEARILAKVGFQHDRDLRGCFEAFASTSAATPTPQPTPTAVPTPTPPPATPTPQPTPTAAATQTPAPPTSTPQTAPTAAPMPTTLAAAVRSAPDVKPAAIAEEVGAPEWLLPTVAGVAGVFVGVLGTTLALRRRGGGA